ncbi:hypothetical protein APR41_15945 [Salegentibacter salinarum]|uniref:Uncharacterized protein n=1 Tax=Salegentibacter salinarum TaxID=447422 RepID=A0A2N0TXK1_9FLAO|nr:hypothetical protein [Salegentibacter salinarum]PKD19451.1 hypothetical protein APR41_15945 [Salegentibacter salinarum]SKB92123.1 hypothetical protein SAMN05660903_03274 [Salegentibacter salinarum]
MNITTLSRPIIIICILVLAIGTTAQTNNEHQVSFVVSGAISGKKTGNAKVLFSEGQNRHFFTIQITDENTNTPEYRLRFRAESWEELGLPEPGEYAIIDRGNPDLGYEAGFEVTYTHYLEYNDSYYQNVAIEYKAQPAWKIAPKGKIIIESVDGTSLTGSFEFELPENTSINKAPLTGKGINIVSGKFNVETKK